MALLAGNHQRRPNQPRPTWPARTYHRLNLTLSANMQSSTVHDAADGADIVRASWPGALRGNKVDDQGQGSTVVIRGPGITATRI